MPSTDHDPLLDISAVAAWTGLSKLSLYHFVSQRRIPFVRISARCIRFRRSDIETWLASKVVEAREK